MLHRESPSSPVTMKEFIVCHQCQMAYPDEFIFLLCDHVICSNCIHHHKQTQIFYDTIKCQCGIVTLIKNNRNKHQQQLKMSHRKIKSNHERLNYSLSKNRLATQVTPFNQSTSSNKLSQRPASGKRRKTQQTEQPSYVRSQRMSENVSYLNHQNITFQLNSQIQFIKIKYEKEVGSIKSIFKKILTKFDEEFRKNILYLKGICTEKILLNLKDTQVNYPKIIHDNYQQHIGSSMEKIYCLLRSCLNEKNFNESSRPKKRENLDFGQFQKQKQKDTKKLQKKGIIKKKNILISL